ncbi:MAG: hypothetical protein D3923_17210, partial [Candidatus Electrothrix sp. AR3]|nr:hypothetical protein [Candidatus Electrothrix sp. AR3]
CLVGVWRHQSVRIDLDAALPPLNAQPYNINSFILSQLVPKSALDDYWINEWPLAYSLGRIFLRIASNGYESQQKEAIELRFEQTYNSTHGCINSGNYHEKLLHILLQADVISPEQVAPQAKFAQAKQWHLSPKLGQVFLILKDRD